MTSLLDFARVGAVMALLIGGTLAASPAQAQMCVDDECPDIREILNPPFPMMPAGMGGPQPMAMASPRPQAAMEARPQAAIEARPQAGMQLASNGPAMSRPAGPQMHYRQFVQARPQAQSRPPAAPPAKTDGPNTGDTRGVAEWAAQCPQNQTTGCEIIRRVMRQDGQPFVSVLVGPDARAPGRNQMLVLLPLGVSVRESVPFLIDEKFIALVPIETCLPAGCLMRIALSPPMVGVLRAGAAMKLLALSPEGQTVPIVVPINGFGDAFTKVSG